jgi:hypothetical protein
MQFGCYVPFTLLTAENGELSLLNNRTEKNANRVNVNIVESKFKTYIL